MNKLGMWAIAIAAAFVVCSIASVTIVFADDDDGDNDLSELTCEAGKSMTGILFEDDDEITDILCGDSGSSSFETYFVTRTTSDEDFPKGTTVTIDCEEGDLLLSGGYELSAEDSGLVVLTNRPLDTDTWLVEFDASPETATTNALCLRIE